MTKGVIQRARVGVGYDRMSSGAAGDVLVTSGLGNCIAVAARDTNTNRAVMAHYNTVGGYTTQALQTVRATVAAELQRVVGGAVAIRYAVGLGSVWFGHDYDDDPNSANSRLWNARNTLILNIISVFGVEPTQAGFTIEFNSTTGAMSGNSSTGANIAIPDNWQNSGTAL